jgi:hypothetical protein
LRPLRTGLIEVGDDPKRCVAGLFHSRNNTREKS